MGNIFSASPSGNNIATHYDIGESETMEDGSDLQDGNMEEQFHDTIDNEDEVRINRRQEKLNEFKRQLDVKREQRKEILARHRAEKKNLEEALYAEKKLKIELSESNKALKKLLDENNIAVPENLYNNVEHLDLAQSIYRMNEEAEKLKANNKELRINLAASNMALQDAYSDIADLSAQNTESIKQINALKEVVAVSKTMISLREDQLNELKQKLNEIEQSLADREANMLSTDLRQEYERQLQNIRTLRGLYEERSRLAEVTKQALVRELEEHKQLYQTEVNKNADLNNKIDDLESTVSKQDDIINDKSLLITSIKAETQGLKSEMSAVNKLFAQVLLGYNSKKYLDTLVHRLEENHGILAQMAEKENGSEVSTVLPKMLLELVGQIYENDKNNSPDCKDELQLVDQTAVSGNDKQMPSKAEEIVQNLPKVWRVLMELLSHQSEPETNNEKVTTCYKSVNTNSGPVLVPSVSQTYIRLKDLILEKLALIKEVNKMKQLNTHLETRLGEQEKRLCLVTNELTKTWHVVGRLRRHHHQLHTHEKILKYELQQKRKLLNELKEELEYCREKCDQAREKNSQSERDWKKLRAEFSSRKLKTVSPSLNNSGESGYSDERPSDESSESNDESEYATEPKIKCKKKTKKIIEAVLDSSADFNLVAEREDPASDMLDVAELPLDSHDGVCDASTSCNSESYIKCDKVVETEDECADICNDSCIEDISTVDNSVNNNNQINDNNTAGEKSEKDSIIVGLDTSCTKTDQPSTSSLIDPATILKNIQIQNERLAKKDKKMELLERDSTALLKKTQAITTLSNTINNTLDVILNRPTASREVLLQDDDDNDNDNLKLHQNYQNSNETNTIIDLQNNNEVRNETSIQDAIQNHDDINEISLDSDLIQENNIDTFNNNHSSDTQPLDINLNTHDEMKISSEASTSSDINHEARFAARDLRLKRLEEQTKSLVNKVNKTTSKGVKIHYKLEELHNIYGSENSRSGTPSEDTEDTSQNTDEE